MTITENTDQRPACECGCCGPQGATAVMDPPEASQNAERESGCDCDCGDEKAEDCDCGCYSPVT